MALTGCCGSDEPHLGADGPPTLLIPPLRTGQGLCLAAWAVLISRSVTTSSAWLWADSPAWFQTYLIFLDLPGASWAMYDHNLRLEFTPTSSLWNYLIICICRWTWLPPLACLCWTPKARWTLSGKDLLCWMGYPLAPCPLRRSWASVLPDCLLQKGWKEKLVYNNLFLIPDMFIFSLLCFVGLT